MKKSDTKEIITLTEKLLHDFAHFHQATKICHATIGKRAARNANIWKNLTSGKTITLEIADRLYAFMAEQGYDYRVQRGIYLPNTTTN